MKKPSPRPARTPVGRKSVSAAKTPALKKATKKSVKKKTVPKQSARKFVKKSPAKKTLIEKDAPKKSRAKITSECPQNLKVLDDDPAGVRAVAIATAKSFIRSRPIRRPSAVDQANAPPTADDPQTSLVERVSHAIERELSKIEVIIGGSHVPLGRRTEAESRARVLASLARTLKEVKRLREQEREESESAHDDAIPRDLAELRSELARRLEILVGEAKTLHPDATE